MKFIKDLFFYFKIRRFIKIPMLKSNEELELIKLLNSDFIQKQLKKQKQDQNYNWSIDNPNYNPSSIKNKLINHNYYLAYYIAKQYKDSENYMEDLFYYACNGLSYAIKTFNLSEKQLFKDYAKKCIKNEIIKEIQKYKIIFS